MISSVFLNTDLPELTPGYYWAQWVECDEDTEDHLLFEARDFFAPVEVTLNDKNPNSPQHLRVFVLGFGGSQDLRNFVWGDRIGDLWPTQTNGKK